MKWMDNCTVMLNHGMQNDYMWWDMKTENGSLFCGLFRFILAFSISIFSIFKHYAGNSSLCDDSVDCIQMCVCVCALCAHVHGSESDDVSDFIGALLMVSPVIIRFS